MPATRNAKGQWVSALVIVELSNGKTKEYRIPASALKSKQRMDALYATLVSSGGGGVIIDVYSMFGESDDVDPADYLDDAADA